MTTNAGLKYGFAYQGCKSYLAEQIIDVLQAADYFVDLFAGGLAMTHVACASGKYKHVISNDIQGLGVAYLREAETVKLRFVTREQFNNDSRLPRILKSIFSFAKSCRTYLCAYDEKLPMLFNALVYEEAPFQYKVRNQDLRLLRRLTGYEDGVLMRRVRTCEDIVQRYNSFIKRAKKYKK